MIVTATITDPTGVLWTSSMSVSPPAEAAAFADPAELARIRGLADGTTAAIGRRSAEALRPVIRRFLRENAASIGCAACAGISRRYVLASEGLLKPLRTLEETPADGTIVSLSVSRPR